MLNLSADEVRIRVANSPWEKTLENVKIKLNGSSTTNATTNRPDPDSGEYSESST